MTLTINDTTMLSDQSAHTARQAPTSHHLWEVSWLPGRVLDRNSAITAMVLADQVGEHDLNKRHRLWPFIENRAAELGLTGPTRSTGSPGPVPWVGSTTGRVSGPALRQDHDCAAA
jgi:hypothetical protein